MGILDYLRPNIFNNPVANSQGMYNPNKKINTKPEFLLGKSPLDNSTSGDIYSQLQKYTNTQNILHGSDTPLTQQNNPPSIQNGKLVQGTPIQEQPSLVVNGEYNPSIQTSPFKDPSVVDAQLNALFSQTQPIATKQSKTNILGERVPMQNLDSGVGYVNGKLFDSNKNSFSGMFDGYSKERDAAIDPKTGRIDRNSEFYKRNKKAMENL